MYATVTRMPDRAAPRSIACARRIAPVLSGLLLAAFTCGCAQQIKWYPDYPQGEQAARAGNRPMLLYFRDWLSREQARIDLQVSPDPRVTAAMRRTINVRLEAGWFRDLAHQYDVRQTPTFILTDSNGLEQARLSGVPTPQDFVAWLEESLRRRGATQPAGSATRPAATRPSEAPAPAVPPATQSVP
jgi:hypothetical protein